MLLYQIYTWINIKMPSNNNSFKKSAPVWEDKFELPDRL